MQFQKEHMSENRKYSGMKKKTHYFPKYCSIKFVKFIFELHFGDSNINTRFVPFSSIVGARKLLDYIYMKKCICRNRR